MSETDFFKPLKGTDIQEKIDINLRHNRTVREIRDSLLQEKHELERNVLRQQVQIQNLKEQIEYVNHLIEKEQPIGR